LNGVSGKRAPWPEVRVRLAPDVAGDGGVATDPIEKFLKASNKA
jgi:hypothetical protein